MRGDKPDRSKIHHLKGPTGRRRAKVQEPPRPLVDLTPPRRLKGIALATWKRLAPQLLKDHTLTELSVNHFIAYCDAVALYEHTAAIVDRLVAAGKPLSSDTPNGGRQQLPEVGIKNRTLADIRWLGEVFAIDPYSRERRGLHVPADPEDEDAGKPSLLSRPGA